MNTRYLSSTFSRVYSLVSSIMSLACLLPKDPRPFVNCKVENQETTALVDSGSEVTVIDERLARKLKIDLSLLTPTSIRLFGANGSPIFVHGICKVLIELGKSCRFRQDVLVTSNVTTGLILGADLLTQQGLILDAARKRLCKPTSEKGCKTVNSTSLERQSEKLVKVQTPFKSCDLLFTPYQSFLDFQPGLCSTDENGNMFVLWQNPQNLSDSIPRDTEIGTVSLFDHSLACRDIKWTPKEMHSLATHSTLPSTDLLAINSRAQLAKQVPLSHLSEDLRPQYLSLFAKFTDIFSLNPNDIGKCSALPQRITLKDPSSISCIPPYRTPPHLQPVVRDYVQNLLDAGIIQKSTSPFCSPLLLVRKANAKPSQPLVEQFRVVHDYRCLNRNTVRDSYPLHNLYDLIDKVASSKVWSVIDLSSGFWNQTLDPSSSPYTAFAVPGMGHYEYSRSAQGLCNSPAAFQRLLDFVVRGIPNCYVYIDDLVVASADHQDHLQTLANVFQRFRKYNLKCRPHKLQIATAEINYLGYNLSHDKGIRPGYAKTQAVANWKEPQSVKEIRQFLGLCSFFRRTIKDFASIASPLTKLTRKDAEWKSGPLPLEAKASFYELKKRLTSRPCLVAPNFDLPFILSVDASTTGLGAVLSQKHPGQAEAPVAYASRVLKDAEKKNAPFHLEYLAMVWACRHFKPYLIGKRFTLRSDHKPLQTLNKTKGAAFERCLLELSEFDFEVEYLKGEKMPADGLSRQTAAMEMSNLKSYINFSWSQVREVQKQDPEIKALAIALYYQKVAKSENLKHFVETHLPNAYLEEGVVVRKGTPKVVYTPRALRQTLLNVAHNCPAAGHYGTEKTLHRLQECWYWPEMKEDVALHCKSCQVCQKTNQPPSQQYPLQRLPVAQDFNHRVHVDLLGPLPDNQRYKYIMVIVDAFSKYLQVVPLENKAMATTSTALMDHWITLFGIPHTLISDQGREFVNQNFALINRTFGITHKTTSPYHPMANGQAEASVREVLRYVRKYTETNDWLHSLPTLRMAHNMAFNSTIKCSPYEAAFCRRPILPGNWTQAPPKDPLYKDDAMTAKVHHFTNLRHKVLAEAEKSFLEWKKYFDKKAKARSFEVGDKVFLKRPHDVKQYHKFQDKYEGPYLVTKVLSKGNLEICPMDPNLPQKKKVIHSNNVKLLDAAAQIFDFLPAKGKTPEIPSPPPDVRQPLTQSSPEEIEDFVSPAAPACTPGPVAGTDRPSPSHSRSSTEASNATSGSSSDSSLSLSSDDSTSSFHDATSDSQNEEPVPETAAAGPSRSTRSRAAPLPASILSRYLPLRRHK